MASTPTVSGNALYAAAYGELQRIARRERRRANSPATLDTTALVHEAWFKLDGDAVLAGLPRIEFLAVAARAMRQVLVDHARRLGADKRRHLAVTLDRADAQAVAAPVALLELDDALRRLESQDPLLARIVELHVFSGLEFTEIATIERMSERSVFRNWRSARVFLLEQLDA